MKSFKVLFLGVFVMLVMAGCVSTPEEDSYKEAMEGGRIEVAYLALKGICEANPKASSCKEMGSLSEDYAELRLNKLSAEFAAAERPITMPVLESSLNEFHNIRRIAEVDGLQAFYVKYDQEYTATESAINESLSAFEASQAAGDRRLAYDNLLTAVKLDPSLKKRMESFIATAVKETFLEGKEASKNDDWRAAHEAYLFIKYVSPENKKIDALLAEATLKDTYEYRVEEGKKALSSGDYVTALNSYTIAKTYRDEAEVKDLINEVSILMADEHFTYGVLFSRNGKLLNAGSSFVKGVNIVKGLSVMSKKKVSIPAVEMSRLMGELFVLAKKEHEAGSVGKSIVAIEMIEAIEPDYPELLTLKEELRAEVKRLAEESLAVIPFTGPSYSPDAGSIVTSKLIHSLYNELSDELKILERGALEALIKETEVKVLQSGAGDKDLISIIDADYMLFGDVVDYKVESNVQESTRTVRARVEVKQSYNPAHEAWLKKKKGEEPPKYLEEPVYEMVKYNTSRHKKLVTLTVGYRLVDASGDIIHTGMVEETDELIGESSDGVEIGDFHVESKVADLPSDSEILRDAVAKLIEQVTDDLTEIFSNPEERLSTRAEKHIKKKDFNKALETLVQARYLTRARALNTDNIDFEITRLIEKAGM